MMPSDMNLLLPDVQQNTKLSIQLKYSQMASQHNRNSPLLHFSSNLLLKLIYTYIARYNSYDMSHIL